MGELIFSNDLCSTDLLWDGGGGSLVSSMLSDVHAFARKRISFNAD